MVEIAAQQRRDLLPVLCVCGDCGEAFVRGPFGRTNRCRSCGEMRRKAYQLRRTAARHAQVILGDVAAGDVRRLLAAAVECPLCGVELERVPGPRQAQVDHIVPLAVGGEHVRGNLRVICRSCNVRRPHDGSDVLEAVAS